MTLFDYLVLFVLLCSIVISCLRGLVKEVLSLAGWALAFVLANAYSEDLAALLPEVLPGATVRTIAAFLALFIGVKLLAALLGMAVQEMLKATGLVVVDRGLGVFFGLARGLVLVMAAVLIAGLTALPQQTFWKTATLSPLAESAAHFVLPFLPPGFAAKIRF